MNSDVRFKPALFMLLPILRVSLTLFVCSIVVACSSIPKSKFSGLEFQSLPIDSLWIIPAYTSSAPESNPAELAQLPLWLHTRSISGDFYGKTEEQGLNYAQLKPDYPVEFDLEEVRTQLMEDAETAGSTKSKLIVTPSDTTISRLGTFLGYDDQEFLTVFSTTRKLSDQTRLILVFVDKPCHIGGFLFGKNETAVVWTELEVTFAESGLHWLLVDQTDSKRFKITQPPLLDKVYLLAKVN